MENDLIHLWTHPNAVAVFRALLLVIMGFALSSLLSRLAVRSLKTRLTVHLLQLLRRLIYYGILVLFIASALRELGFNLGLLLGAAGVLSVAIGFASQTSVSNLISGLFLVAERPFSIGDVIQVGSTTGEVLSVDALSVKLRTFDNLFVRIPNESLIKSQFTNFTRFDIRRFDLKIGVGYKEDVRRVREVFMKVAQNNPYCLDEPAPAFSFVGFGESAINLQLSAWASRSSFSELGYSLQTEIKEALEAAGIEIPFPQRSIYISNPSELRGVDDPKAHGDDSITGETQDPI